MTHKRAVDVEGFDANLLGLVLPMGLRIERVSLTGIHLHLEGDPFAITSPEPGNLEVFVGERDIATFLNKLSPAGLKNIKVQAKEGLLHLNATKTVLLELSVIATCAFRIEDERRCLIDLKSIDVMGVGTKQLVMSQLDKINPVLDTADFPVDATIETVEIVKGGILVKGRVRTPAA